MHLDDAADLLNISKYASKKEITKAFRRASKYCHPDLFPNDKEKEREFKKISTAYETLMSVNDMVRLTKEMEDDTLDEDFAFMRKQGI